MPSTSTRVSSFRESLLQPDGRMRASVLPFRSKHRLRPAHWRQPGHAGRSIRRYPGNPHKLPTRVVFPQQGKLKSCHMLPNCMVRFAWIKARRSGLPDALVQRAGRFCKDRWPTCAESERHADAFILLCVSCCAVGCTNLRLPAIDPSGQSIFLPAPNFTTLNPNGPFPAPAWQSPPTPPPCETGAATVPYSIYTPNPDFTRGGSSSAWSSPHPVSLRHPEKRS